MKLIVGLGNPGKEYEKTRHNIGYILVDKYLGNVKWSKKHNAEYYETIINNEKYIFIKPTSFMNLSGNVVRQYINYYKLSITDILIIHDDLDLPIGKYRLKVNSSDGGHNGIKDIIKHLQSNSFARIKVGISKNNDIDTKDYVLGTLSKDEMCKINNIAQNIFEIIENFGYDKLEFLMNKFN